MKQWTSAICLASLIGTSSLARSEAVKAPTLSTFLTSCWDAVDENRMGALLVEMAFEGTENKGQMSEYAVWIGTAKTEFGEIDIRVSVRDMVLFDCTMQSFPIQDESNLIEFSEAQDVLAKWFAERMEQPGYFDTFGDLRYFGLARCVVGELTLAASATSTSLVPPEVIVKGSDERITGTLRVSIIRTSPKNFENCAGIGAL